MKRPAPSSILKFQYSLDKVSKFSIKLIMEKFFAKLSLKDEDIHLPALKELINKYKEWHALSLDNLEGRQTRSSNRKADKLYDEIMQYKAKPITVVHDIEQDINYIKSIAGVKKTSNGSSNLHIKSNDNNNHGGRTLRARAPSVDIDSDDDSSASSSRPITRSLRQRCRTPQQNTQPPPRTNTRQLTSPCTPQNQRIRPKLKHPPSSGSSGNSTQTNVLNAALNLQHPVVSVTKIRQLLRQDSAQKKKEEQKERQERLMTDRKAKEERAEAQKKQLLEERAVNAKLKREQRLNNAAELRKKREEAKIEQKIKEERAKVLAQMKATTTKQVAKECKHEELSPNLDVSTNNEPQERTEPIYIKSKHTQINHKKIDNLEKQMTKPTPPNRTPQTPVPSTSKQVPKPDPPEKQISVEQSNTTFNKQQQKHNETFKKPNPEYIDNIDISIKDETTDEDHEKKGKEPVASWVERHYFREALIKQFDKPEEERRRDIKKIFPSVHMPIKLEEIFPTTRSGQAKYLVRTSSAVWTPPPNKGMKRTSSMVLTPREEHSKPCLNH